MKPGTEARLENLAEKLAEVYLEEADPDNWSGADVPMQERDNKHRGDRAWEIKAVNQLGLVFARTLELKVRIKLMEQDNPGSGALPTSDPEMDMKRLEMEASRLIERVRG